LLRQMPPHVLRAYEVWRTNHSAKKTAEIVGVVRQTINKWRKKYRWDDIERARLEATLEEEQSELERIKEEQRKIVRAAIATAVRQMKEGKLKARSMADLVALLRYQRELEGEFNDQQTINVSVGISLVELHEEIMKRRGLVMSAQVEPER